MYSSMPPPNDRRGLSLLRAAPDPRSPEFADRLAVFSIARAVVFTAVCALVLVVLRARSGELFGTFSVRLTLSILALALASAGVQYAAARRKRRLYAVSLGLLLLDQVLFGAIVYLTGGVTSGATSLLGVTCLVGGLLLGTSGALASAVFGGVIYSLVLLVSQGAKDLLPPDQARAVYELSGEQAAYYYVFALLVLLLVGLLSSYLAERLQKAGGELAAAKKRADQAERMAELGRLAAGLAHEIRNPLGSISGAVQMLRTSAERDEDRQLCEIVLRESGRLNELVNDMMDLSRPRQAQKELTDVGRIVSDVVALSSQSGRGAQDVEVVRLGTQTAWVYCDAGQIRQLVWNLVRNAVQASAARGQVLVTLESAARVVLSVADEGIGIDSEALDRLFDAFYTTRSQGTGLGLAVVKRIADEHEFELIVESEHGEGADFRVDFGPPETPFPS